MPSIMSLAAAQGYSASWLLPAHIGQLSPVAWCALAALAAYLAGAISLWRQRKQWSIFATISFVAGIALVVLATGTRLNGLATDLVSVLLFQELTLLVVAPPLLLIGMPGRLALTALPRRGAGRVLLVIALAGYRSGLSRVLLHPLAALVIAAVMLPGLYLSDFVSVILGWPGGHTVLLFVFLVLGVIAGAPLWARDPLPRRPSYVVRLVEVFVEIQIHAVFGLVLLLSAPGMFAAFAGEPSAPGISRALDQAVGGGLMWTYGELPLVIALIVTLSKWRKRDMSTAKSREVEDDAELDRYNEYLAAQRGATTGE